MFLIAVLKNKFFKKGLFVLFLFSIVYSINKLEFPRSGIGSSAALLQVDLFFMALISLSILTVLKDKFISYVLALIPISFFYLFFNEFFVFYKRLFSITDMQSFPELLEVIAVKEIVLIFAISACYMVLLVKNIEFKKLKKPILPVVTTVVLYGSIYLAPTVYINSFYALGYEDQSWDYLRMSREVGYINTLFYNESKRVRALHELESRFSKSDLELNSFENLSEVNKKNVHIVVLESFFDPNLFQNIEYTYNPIAKEFSDIFKGKENLPTSPVYGGSTAQAEFEVLTCLPAKAKYNTIEFNLFTGNPVNSFVNDLKNIGYRTYATNGFKQEVFNSVKAYKGLGFEHQYYIKGETYFSKINKEEPYIFDGDLLEQNINFIKSEIDKHPGQPILNYILGVYGHMENSLDLERHPIFIEAFFEGKKVEDRRFVRAVNQIYYRTKAMANFINKLKEIDPTSMIVLVGDHLLNIPKIKEYGYGDIYKTKAYIINNSKPIKLDSLNHHYQIPQYLFKEITGSNYYESLNLTEAYKKVIFQAITL